MKEIITKRNLKTWARCKCSNYGQNYLSNIVCPECGTIPKEVKE